MSLLPVLTFPHKNLKLTSKQVKEINPTIEQLVADMFDTMYTQNGIGLAAPQVNELIRVIVVDIPLERDPENETPDPLALINPEIIAQEGTIQFDEGCLSCPELIVLVDRFDKIKVRYQDVSGKKCELETSGLKSVCIQHEIDHLNGVLLVDRVSRLERDLYKNKRIKMAKSENDLAGIL